MSLTVAGIENEIIGRIRGTLSNRFYQLSILASGSNPDLRGPIRRAVRFLGGNTADALNVVDADLAAFTGWDIERLIDAAILETLKSCLGQCLSFVDFKTGEDEQLLSQMAAGLRAEIATLEQRVNEPYGPTLGPAVVATMTGQGMPNDPFDPCRTRSRWGHWPYP
jgi:hypothetical protein